MKSNPRIEFTSFFEKQRKNASRDIKQAFLEMLTFFLEDPENPILRNHALKGTLTGYRSFDVTTDVRAVFKEKFTGDRLIIVFHMLGTHNKLYG